MLKQNAVRSKNAKLECRKFSTLQKHGIKMQWKLSVLQYLIFSTSQSNSLMNCLPQYSSNLLFIYSSTTFLSNDSQLSILQHITNCTQDRWAWQDWYTRLTIIRQTSVQMQVDIALRQTHTADGTWHCNNDNTLLIICSALLSIFYNYLHTYCMYR